ncbi:hypothetical protein TYRP_011985 [Tyrophagus putrescentiae]|nr:hypothetical protein TYRP_011985 [Tyrophagus putrescentiae]
MDNVCRSQGTYSAYTVGLNKSATYPGLLSPSNLHQQFPYIRVYREYYSWRQYNYLFAWHLFVEGWNYINVIVQIVLTEKFINFGFESYGRDFLKFKSSLQFDDPSDIVFPLFTNCDYFQLNSTGESYVPISVTCQLLNNDLNGNIFLFIWFWYRLLFIASTIGIFYRIVIYCFPGVHARLHTFGNQKFSLTLVHSLTEIGFS